MYEQFNGTLCERDCIKANGRQGWPHPCAKGEIIRAYYSHFCWHLDPPISQRSQQEQSILVVKGIDAAGTICSCERGLDPRVGGNEVELSAFYHQHAPNLDRTGRNGTTA